LPIYIRLDLRGVTRPAWHLEAVQSLQSRWPRTNDARRHFVSGWYNLGSHLPYQQPIIQPGKAGTKYPLYTTGMRLDGLLIFLHICLTRSQQKYLDTQSEVWKRVYFHTSLMYVDRCLGLVWPIFNKTGYGVICFYICVYNIILLD